MEIPLTLLRDILSNWDSSPALNAARSYELRQPYAELDRLMPKRIVPVELGRTIQTHDPGAQILLVRLKVVPKDYLDSFSVPDYAVVWPAGTWRQSIEYRLSANKAWALDREALIARSEESDRLHRMIKKIVHYLPNFPQIDMFIREKAADETQLKQFITQFETILKIPIYEHPRNAQARPESPESPQAPAQPPGQSPEAGDPPRTEVRSYPFAAQWAAEKARLARLREQSGGV